MKKIYATFIVIITIAVLSSCGNTDVIYRTPDEVSLSEASYKNPDVGVVHGSEAHFQYLGSLVDFMIRYAELNDQSFLNVVRVKILDEEILYEDVFGVGIYIAVSARRAEILDVFDSDFGVGEIIEIGEIARTRIPIEIGDDIILFGIGYHSETIGLSSLASNVYRVPDTFTYPRSITSSILTRNIPNDMEFENINPHNHLTLTIQDLARIAGLCDSPWPGQSEPATSPSQPLYFTLTFNPNNEEANLITLPPKNVTEGTAVYPLVSNLGLQLDKEGYEFIGWYLDEDFAVAVTETFIMPPNNITIFARWSPTANIWEPLDIQLDPSETLQESTEVQTEPPEIDLEPEEVNLESPEIDLEPAQ